MERSVLRTIHDCEDLLEGALWMGTGGGGSFDDGMRLLREALEEGLSLEWVDVEAVSDDVWTATVGLHGSIAPISQETLAQIKLMNLTENSGQWYVARAVIELGEYLGHEYGCIVPAELGPESVAIPLVVGARLGIPVVDGDYIGRAVPEELQSTYCLNGKQSHIFASVDRWGNIAIVKDTANMHAFERIAKMLALAAFGDTAVATTPLIAEEMKEIVVRNTLSKCLKIGRALRHGRDTNECAINAALEIVDGWRLFEGTVIGLETEDRDGYFIGTTRIEGTGDHLGQTLEIWFKNENQVSWLNGSSWVCSPDLLSLVYKETGRGIYNAHINKGDSVTAIGMKGLVDFRTERGLNLAGPRHYGFDIDYTPIEELMNNGS